jgi:peptidoglycan/LPS O-acetylase OafA/YrhL
LLAWRPVAYLGTISYSLFLYHLTIAEFLASDSDPSHFEADGLGLLDDIQRAPTPILFALTLLVATAVASVSYRLTERPFVGPPGR